MKEPTWSSPTFFIGIPEVGQNEVTPPNPTVPTHGEGTSNMPQGDNGGDHRVKKTTRIRVEIPPPSSPTHLTYEDLAWVERQIAAGENALLDEDYDSELGMGAHGNGDDGADVGMTNGDESEPEEHLDKELEEEPNEATRRPPGA